MAHQFMLSPVELGGAISPHLIMDVNDLLFSNLLGLRWHLFIIFLKKIFLALLGLHYARAFSSRTEWGLLSGCSAPASHCGGSLVVEHRLWCQGSEFVADRFSWPVPCGTFLDQRKTNPRPLHWQADSSPLDHREVLFIILICIFLTAIEVPQFYVLCISSSLNWLFISFDYLYWIICFFLLIYRSYLYILDRSFYFRSCQYFILISFVF